jgi:hypothetical protein
MRFCPSAAKQRGQLLKAKDKKGSHPAAFFV